MKKLLLLILAAPLAGCAQRAEMASSTVQRASVSGPFTLRYQLANQSGNQYQIQIEGDTTAGLTSQTIDAGSPGFSTTRPNHAAQAKFQTQMTVRQEASAALRSVSETASTPHAKAGGSGDTTSMNEDRAPGDERPTTTTDLAAEGTWPSPRTPETTSNSQATSQPEQFELHQEVTNWTAQVDLPRSHIIPRLNGTFQDGQLAIEAHGTQVDLPQRYQQQIQRMLNRPVIATVTPTGKILNVEWPAPEQSTSSTPGLKIEPGSDGLRAMIGSTETLNLWFGVIRLPDEAVNVGQTWDARDRFPVRAGADGSSLYMEREAKYTLNNVTQTADGPVAEIALNETLKLIRGELPDDTSAALSTSSTVVNDSVTPMAEATTQPDVLETRMGKVYFNLNRGVIDRSRQHVSVTWAMNIGATAELVTQGQLQGTIHLNRFGIPPATNTQVDPSKDTTPPAGTLPAPTPSGRESPDPNTSTRVPGP